MKTQFYSGIFLLLFITMLAACGGGYDVSGGEYCDSFSSGITIIEPASGRCITYETVASSVGMSGYAFVSPKGVDCHHIFPSQLNLTWHNTSTGKTGTGFIFSRCLPSFFGSIPSTRWGIVVNELQLGSNVIDLTVTDQLDRRGTATITIVRIIDIIAPSITNQSPAPDVIDVATNRILTVRFSEDMLLGSLTTENFAIVDESGVSVSGLRNYDQDNFTWNFDPSSDLLFSTTYTVTIGGGVKDRYGGNILGADVSWSFTTGPNPDVTNPQVVQVDPEPGTLCAASGTTILAHFDEPLDSTTVDATTFLLKDSSAIPVSGSVTYDGITVQFVPDKTLASVSTYEATLTTDIRDLAGNPLGTDYTWTFTTGSAPVGGWVATSTTNAPSKRVYHTAVWTGTEMIIWGGLHLDTFFFRFAATNTGGRYDPISDSWTATSTLNAPRARLFHRAVWTGTEMIVWGGGVINDGGRYNPVTDSWRTVSTINAPTFNTAPSSQDSGEYIAVWTGTEMIIWSWLHQRGGLYDPKSDSWRAMRIGGPPPKRYMRAVWTGTELIVWGGIPSEGARYNPQSNTWTALPSINAPRSSLGINLMWTGTEMLAWDGGVRTTIDSNGFPLRKEPTLRIYNPATDTWRVTDSKCEPFIRTNNIDVIHAYWTGNRMMMWSGAIAIGYFYDPAVDDWQSIATTSRPPQRDGGTSIWASDQFIFWGGQTDGTGISDTGFIFRE